MGNRKHIVCACLSCLVDYNSMHHGAKGVFSWRMLPYCTWQLLRRLWPLLRTSERNISVNFQHVQQPWDPPGSTAMTGLPATSGFDVHPIGRNGFTRVSQYVYQPRAAHLALTRYNGHN